MNHGDLTGYRGFRKKQIRKTDHLQLRVAVVIEAIDDIHQSVERASRTLRSRTEKTGLIRYRRMTYLRR